MRRFLVLRLVWEEGVDGQVRGDHGHGEDGEDSRLPDDPFEALVGLTDGHLPHLVFDALGVELHQQRASDQQHVEPRVDELLKGT